MLYLLYALFATNYAPHWFLNLLEFLTFRTGGGFVTSLLVALAVGRPLFETINRRRMAAVARAGLSAGSEAMPGPLGADMGGLVVFIPYVVSTLLWADLTNVIVWAVLLASLGFGIAGLLRDVAKLTSSRGAFRGFYVVALVVFAAAITLFGILFAPISPVLPELSTSIVVPFSNVIINFGYFYIVIEVALILVTSVAVRVSSEVDDSTIAAMLLVAAPLLLVAYFSGSAVTAQYLGIQFVPGGGELAIPVAAMFGAMLGFWFCNLPVVRIEMGATGSYFLGATLAVLAMFLHFEIGLFVVTIILFVCEPVGLSRRVSGRKLFVRSVFREIDWKL